MKQKKRTRTSTQLTKNIKIYLMFKFTMYSGGKMNKETSKSNFVSFQIFL